MGKRKGWLCLMLLSEFRQFCNHVHQLLAHQFQSFCHDNNVCIVSYITTGSSKVNNSFGFWTLYTICVYMGHHIVAYLFFSFFCHLIVNVVCICLQFINLFLGNIQSQFFLCLCQRNPQFSPGTEFHVRRKNILHFFTCITLG